MRAGPKTIGIWVHSRRDGKQPMSPQDPVGVRPVLCTRRDEGGRLTCSEFI